MNAKKIIAIVGGSLAAFGIIITVVFMSVLGWNFAKLDLTERGKEVKQDFDVVQVSRIQMDLADRELVVRPSSNGRITLFYQDFKKEPIVFTNLDGILRIEQQKTEYRFLEDLFSGMFQGFASRQVVLEVPAGFNGSFDLATSNAPLSFSGMQSAGAVTLSTSNSKMEASEFTAENADLSSENGPVRVTGASVSEVRIMTSNSSLKVQNVVAEKEITIQNANGKIEVEQTSAGSLQTKTSNAGTRLSDCTVSGQLKVQNVNGSIGLEAVDALDVSLSTTNASVKGSLAGRREDYRIDAKTTNASNNLETNFTGERMLTVRNENGKIDIAFEP